MECKHNKKPLVKAIYILIIPFLAFCCSSKQKNIQNYNSFVPYYVEAIGDNGIQAYQHFIYTSNKEVSDSVLISYVNHFKRTIVKDTPIASIFFITDTVSFSKNYDEQDWDKIRATFYKDIIFNFKNQTNSLQIKAIGYWSQGKRIEVHTY